MKTSLTQLLTTTLSLGLLTTSCDFTPTVHPSNADNYVNAAFVPDTLEGTLEKKDGYNWYIRTSDTIEKVYCYQDLDFFQEGSQLKFYTYDHKSTIEEHNIIEYEGKVLR